MTTHGSVVEPEARAVDAPGAATAPVPTAAPRRRGLRWIRANLDRTLGVVLQGTGALVFLVGTWFVRTRAELVTELGHAALFGAVALLLLVAGAHLLVAADVADLETVLAAIEDRRWLSAGPAASSSADKVVSAASVGLVLAGFVVAVVGALTTFPAASVEDAITRAGIAGIGVLLAAVGFLLPSHLRIRAYRMRLHRLLDDLERLVEVSVTERGVTR